MLCYLTMTYQLVFDEVILSQLKKAGKNQKIKEILSKMLDKLELIGPYAGELIDSKLLLYEISIHQSGFISS
jgi:hypothetical protein